MELKQCINGHFYDSSLPGCPTCANQSGAKSSAKVENYGRTEPLRAPNAEDYALPYPNKPADSYDAMTPVYGETVPPTGPVGQVAGGTRPPEHNGYTEMVFGREEWGYDKTDNRRSNDGATGYLGENDIEGFLPIVGWLVCVEGPERGKDYRIHSGYNNIGKDASMDIVLNDAYVSRIKDCCICYDPQERKFIFGHENGRNMIYVNGKGVWGSVILNARDILKIGSCKYLFVPLCGTDFSWE